MNTQTVKEQLTRLKLGFSASNLEDVLAKNKKAVSLEWLSELLELEIDNRKEKINPSQIDQANNSLYS